MLNHKPEKYQQILLAIEKGHTIVTGSQRLAREILLQHADRISRRQDVWQRPAVLPWSDWLRELWHETAWVSGRSGKLRLLSPGKKRVIWENLVANSGVGGALLQVHSVARAASDAWDLARDWRVPLASMRDLATEDAARFLEWVDAYEKLCKENRWLDGNALPKILSRHLAEAGSAVLPEAITLAGFDEVTPSRQRFLAQVEAAGTTVDRWLPSVKGNPAQVSGAPDRESEIMAAARWALQCLADDPSATVGVVVPDLAERRASVTRIFSALLTPAACEQPGEPYTEVFSVSAGDPLLAQPLIRAAIDLLAMTDPVPPWSLVSHLLRSPHLGESASEAGRRSALDIRLRERGGIRWPLAWLQRVLDKEDEKSSSCACPALNKRVQAALAAQRSWPGRQSTRDWVLALSAWLDTLGWPGDRALNSVEFQAQQRWREMLEDLASYEDVLGDISLTRVLGLLRNLAATSTFKPESARAPVLLVGVMEAAGLEFDHLWISGMHDGAWPPAPAPTPFLPYSLQRSLGLPRGSAARELEFARLLLARMVASSPDVRISWPQAEGDEPLRPSALLDEFEASPDSAACNPGLEGRAGDMFAARPQLEIEADGVAPAFDTSAPVGGGARVLQLQSNCPFRAFAELRLGARPLEQPTAGLNPRQRGQLAHDSLHFIWAELHSQGALARLDAADRATLVNRSLDKAIRRVDSSGNPLLHSTVQIEKSRLFGLLAQLLELELRRPEFKVVSTEKRHTIAIGKLRMSVQPDRIDQVAGDGYLILDYKTGSASISGWLGERPGDPQLPLYATGLGLPDIHGISFVELRSSAVRYVGLCNNREGMPAGVSEPGKNQLALQGASSWEDMLASWKQTICQLAESFQQGVAKVDPTRDACQYCHLQSVCRIEEKRHTGEVAIDA